MVSSALATIAFRVYIGHLQNPIPRVRLRGHIPMHRDDSAGRAGLMEPVGQHGVDEQWSRDATKRRIENAGKMLDREAFSIRDGNAEIPLPNRAASTSSSWREAKRPIFKFVFFFAGFMGLFAVFFYGFLTDTRAFDWYLTQNARVSAAILGFLGEDAHAIGAQVASSRFRVEIRHGCDAILPAGLFVTAVLAFPVAQRLKWPGIIIGTIILLTINLVRIVSLYYVGVFWPTFFHTMHVDVWQPAFVFLSLFLWIAWGVWATRPTPVNLSQSTAG